MYFISGFFISERQLLTITHIYFNIIEGFILYFVSLNLVNKEEQIRVIYAIIIVICLITNAYFIYEYLYIMRYISPDRLLTAGYQSYYTVLTEIYRGDTEVGGSVLKAWMGGPNGRAKFSLILFAFTIGYLDWKEDFFLRMH